MPWCRRALNRQCHNAIGYAGKAIGRRSKKKQLALGAGRASIVLVIGRRRLVVYRYNGPTPELVIIEALVAGPIQSGSPWVREKESFAHIGAHVLRVWSTRIDCAPGIPCTNCLAENSVPIELKKWW